VPGRLRDLRTRLTLWYTALVGGFLLLLGVGAFALLDRGLRDNVDASLRSVAVTIATSRRCLRGSTWRS
jgi:hypothetical protein